MSQTRNIIKLPNIVGATASVEAYGTKETSDRLCEVASGKMLTIFNTSDIASPPITSILVGASLSSSEMGIKLLKMRANINLEDSAEIDRILGELVIKDPDDSLVEGDPVDHYAVDIIRSDLAIGLTSAYVLDENETLSKKVLMLFFSQTFGQALTVVRNYRRIHGEESPVDLGHFVVEPLESPKH